MKVKGVTPDRERIITILTTLFIEEIRAQRKHFSLHLFAFLETRFCYFKILKDFECGERSDC